MECEERVERPRTSSLGAPFPCALVTIAVVYFAPKYRGAYKTTKTVESSFDAQPIPIKVQVIPNELLDLSNGYHLLREEARVVVRERERERTNAINK